MKYPSPLRYPGGKNKLASFVDLILQQNQLLGGEYIEAYAGGASIALRLLMTGRVSRIHINDISQQIYCFWDAVLNETDALVQKIRKTPISMRTWGQQRAILDHPENRTPLEIAFSTFFLNRTNRSGIITGGVIGGKSQAGDWQLDARFNREGLITRIQEIAKFRQGISLYNLDAATFIQKIPNQLATKALMYLDPPYYSKGKRLYTNHYSHADHAAIAAIISKLKIPWMVSYDNAPQVYDLYDQYERQTYSLQYSANLHAEGAEVIFFSPDLIVPEVENPARIKANDRRGEGGTPTVIREQSTKA